MIDAPKPPVVPPEAERGSRSRQSPTQPDFGAWLERETPPSLTQPAHSDGELSPWLVLEAKVQSSLAETAELSAVSESGEVMTRALPWQLIANGVLSQLWQSAEMQRHLPPIPTLEASGPRTTATATPAAAVANTVAEKVVPEQARLPNPSFPMPSHRPQSATDVERAVEERRASTGAERLVWPARLSRLLGHADGAMEQLWVRD